MRTGQLSKLGWAVAVSILISAFANGASYTWKGNQPEWNKAANWSPTGIPTQGDYVTFDTTAGAQDPTIDQNSGAAAMRFASGVRAIIISGSSTLSLVSGMTNESVNQQTISAPLNLIGSQQWQAAAGNFTIGGTVNLNANTLTVSGAYNTTINGAVSGTGGLAKSGNGTLTLNGNNSFSGAVNINGGTLLANAGGALGNVGSVTVSGGTLSLGGSGDRINNAAPIYLSGGGLTANNLSEIFGALTISGNSIITLSPGGAAATLTFASGTWTAGTLTIYGWSGQWGQSGTDDRIFFTSKPDNTFLSYVTFSGYSPGGMLIEAGTSWELVPVPEVSEHALLAGFGLLGFAAHRRFALAKSRATRQPKTRE